MDRLGTQAREVREQHPIRVAEVRFGVVRRDVALVAPKDLDPAPVDAVHPRRAAQEREDDLRRRPSGEGNEEASALLHGALSAHDEAIGSLGRQCGLVREDDPGRVTQPPSSWAGEIEGPPDAATSVRAAARKPVAACRAASYTGSLRSSMSCWLSSSASRGTSIVIRRRSAVMPSAFVATVASSPVRSMMNSAAPVSP